MVVAGARGNEICHQRAPMKILEVNKFHYRRGGADHHFLDLCELLKKKGEDVAVFSMKDKRNERNQFEKYFVSNIEFGKLDWKFFSRPVRMIYSREAKRKIERLIGDFKPDIAHLHLIYHHLSPSILVALNNAKIPTILTIHDWKLICPNYQLFTQGEPCERCRGGKYYQCSLHKCVHNSCAQSMTATVEAYIHHAKKYYENYIDCLIAPSEFVKNKFIEFGWKAEKIVVLPHFISDRIQVLGSASVAPKEKNFVYVGRLSAEKGVDRLIDFWVQNRISYPLNIYGDGPLFNKIKKQAMKNSSIFVHGQVDREKVFEKLSDATAVIIPSACYETFGLVAIESWARGVPVVASNLGGLEELIKKSGAGVLFDWKSDNIVGALEKVDDFELRQKAIAYMREYHDSGEYFKKIMSIFSGLLSV